MNTKLRGNSVTVVIAIKNTRDQQNLMYITILYSDFNHSLKSFFTAPNEYRLYLLYASFKSLKTDHNNEFACFDGI